MTERLAQLERELESIQKAVREGLEFVLFARAQRSEGRDEVANGLLRRGLKVLERMDRMALSVSHEALTRVVELEASELEAALEAEIEATRSSEFDCDDCQAAWCDGCAKADSLADTVPVTYR